MIKDLRQMLEILNFPHWFVKKIRNVEVDGKGSVTFKIAPNCNTDDWRGIWESVGEREGKK